VAGTVTGMHATEPGTPPPPEGAGPAGGVTPSTSAAGADTSPGGPREYVLTLSCPDRPGIVYAVASFLVQHRCNIVQSQQCEDRGAGRFFMRVQFDALDPVETLDRLRGGFDSVAQSFHMAWHLVDAGERYRVLLLVSRFGHCLNDLLFRHRIGALRVDIPAVVSNHLDFEPLARWHGIPFVHIPVAPDTRDRAESRLLELVDSERVDLLVLARYMQVLSPQTCERLEGRAINIHHSFLPSFRGAKPYHQAHERGVKLIGATAHYVTSVLDEGPIIEQEVTRVDHSYSPEQMVAAGRDVECQVLANAVTWHTENRVLLNGHRTVVFR
jgi:formyltetrahydrofolate deformylase